MSQLQPVNLNERFSPAPDDNDDEVEIVVPPPKKAKKDTGPYSKYWVFTWNNFVNPQAPRDWPDVQYAVWQHEKAPGTGTPHLQGYVAFKQKKRLTWLKDKCSRVPHWAARRGNHQEAKAYSMKDDSREAGPWEIGDELRIVVRDDVTMEEAFNVLAGAFPDSPE